MKNQFLYNLAVATLFLGACTPKVTKVVVAPQAAPIVTPIPAEKPAPTASRGIPRESYVVAKIKKTPCYGQCPVYEAAFWSDGTATFKGIRNVKNIGEFVGKFDPKLAREISDRADSIGYFSMNGEYPMGGEKISDLPYTITEIRRGDMIKHIDDNYDSPVALQEFEEYLATLAAKMEWRKNESEKDKK
jgi:Domain of unknown function (DUF6438)